MASEKKRRSSLEPELVPRAGRQLHVVGVARISTLNQDELSLGDQKALYEGWLGGHTTLPWKLKMISSRGSGERLDRKELKRLRRFIRSERVDLVLAEDVGRIMRRMQAFGLCELCEDHNTRLIAINDHVDTATDGWQTHALFASFRHENYNRDTAKRIRRTQRNRFQNGGHLRVPILGYIKPPGIKNDADLLKADFTDRLYDEWFSMLEGGAGYCEVADWLVDWLKKNEVPLPPGLRSGRVTGKYIKETTFNTILKGTREHNQRITKRVNTTGRRKIKKAHPDELLQRECPHLIAIAPARWDALTAKLTRENARYSAGRSKHSGDGPSKKRSRWPGKHIYCGICGRRFVWGGHGQKNHLMCQGARQYNCWNSISIDGPLAVEKLTDAMFAEIASLPEFDQVMVDLVRSELNLESAERGSRVRALQQADDRVTHEIANVVDAIAAMGINEHLSTKLRSLQDEKVRVRLERTQLDATSEIVLPQFDSCQVQDWARAAFQDVAVTSQQFARLMRKLIPKIVVFPHELCDKSALGLRARFRLCLANLDKNARRFQCVQNILTRKLSVDNY